jgi:hypothetical protein
MQGYAVPIVASQAIPTQMSNYRNLRPSDLAKLQTKFGVSQSVIKRSLCVNHPEPGCQVGNAVNPRVQRPAASRDDLPAAELVPTTGTRNAGASEKAKNQKPAVGIFEALLQAEGLPIPESEYRFHPDRKWRFDFAWPAQHLALEVEGGVWSKGRHTRPKGFLGDMEKYNAAAVLGWRVLRCTPDTLTTAQTVLIIRKCFE